MNRKSSEYDYRYDPDHKIKPEGGGWVKTEKGWSLGEDEKANKTTKVNKPKVLSPKKIYNNSYRSPDKEPEFKKDNIPAWKKEHTATTKKGSLMIGTPHFTPSGETQYNEGASEFIEKDLIPSVLSHAKKQIDAGKKVVFLAEGGIDSDTGEPWKQFNDDGIESEQYAVYSALKNKYGNKVEVDTFEDSALSVQINGKWHINKKGKTFKDTQKDFGLPEEDVEIGMIGLNISTDTQGEAFGISDKARSKLKAIIKSDIPENIEAGKHKELREKIYKHAYSDGTNESNPIMEATACVNRSRDKAIVNAVYKHEKQGKSAIVTPGYTHAYQLKNVIKKM